MKTILSYILYYIGHVISIPCFRVRGFSWLYKPYNWLMQKSVELDSGNKLWKE